MTRPYDSQRISYATEPITGDVLETPQDVFPRPLWAGARGRGLAPTGAHDFRDSIVETIGAVIAEMAASRDDDRFSGALPRANPAP